MFAQKIYLAVAACGLLASTVCAHMVITSPIPYGKSTLDNSPLVNDGSDFPCKQRSGVYDISTINKWPVGSKQTLSFMGGATHGGGSCQVSISLDQQPTQASEWKVINSIVGGCPSNATGNLGSDASGTDASVFQFEVPSGIPNGQYSMAWTWFNKIGNREMYMNCAPIEVSGGSDDTTVYDALPDMFVINIPNEDCANVEGEDFVFPSPGTAAQTPFSTALGSSTVGTACASVTGKGAGNGKAGSVNASGATGSAAATATGNASTGTTTAAAATATASSPIIIATQASTTAPTAANTAAPIATSAAAPVAPSAAAGGNTSTSSGTCASGSVSCSTPGDVVCIGSDSWGLCDIDNCAVTMALADGTACAGGVVSKKRSLVGGRSMRHLRRHSGGHAAGLHGV